MPNNLGYIPVWLCGTPLIEFSLAKTNDVVENHPYDLSYGIQISLKEM